MSKAILRQRQRLLVAGIKAEIQHYESCLKKINRVDQQVIDAGMQLFSNEKDLARWLCHPARSLGGKIPLDVMRTAKGRKELAGKIMMIAHGTYL